jgi:hypothetical protein
MLIPDTDPKWFSLVIELKSEKKEKMWGQTIFKHYIPGTKN